MVIKKKGIMLSYGIDKVSVTVNVSNDNLLLASVSSSSIVGRKEMLVDESLVLEN